MKKTRRSYFYVMTRDFILFVVLILVSIFIIIWMREYVVDKSMRNYLNSSMKEVPNSFIEGNYQEFNIDESLGKYGKFEILNRENSIIYPTEAINNKSFNDYELMLIPDEANRPIITKEEYEEFNGKKYIGITFEYYDDLSKDYQNILVVDDNYKLNFTTISHIKEDLTKREFNLLSGLYQGYEISKSNFIDYRGQKCTALFYRKYNPMHRVTNSLKGMAGYSVFAFIVFFIVASLIHLINLDKRVKVPIQLLEDAINQFSEGKTDSVISYKGPYEFENVCKNLNDMLVKLNEEEMKRKLVEEEKNRIVADISHDLKTPITVIQGFSKMLLDKKVPDSEHNKYLERIYNKSQSIADLINTFNEYSKLERLDFSMNFAQINLNQYIRDYFDEKTKELELQHYKIKYEILDESVMCNIDRMQFIRIFDNIISNMIKYTPKGTILFFYERIQGESINLYVGNNGPDIDKSIGDKIFKPFVVGDEARTVTNSSGLGLSIVKRIVELHHGTIRLLDNPKKGITILYEIVLPRIDK